MSEPGVTALVQWCNECFRDTFHDTLLEEGAPTDGDETHHARGHVATVRCRGCHAWSIRRTVIKETGDQAVSHDPPQRWRRPPDWMVQLPDSASDVAALLDEIYLSANGRQSRLLSMGVRAVLDRVMIQIVGDVGGFARKLDAMRECGHLSRRQVDMLKTIIDAGSAAAHRGYKPPPDLLQEMLIVMGAVIRDHFITSPMLDQLKRFVPPKPPRA